MDKDQRALYFSFFNEIGIIAQLSRAMIEEHLPRGMLLPHFSVINHLIRVSDGQTPQVLARAFQVPKTSMTHTIGGLESAGYVDVRPNPKDGRSKCVWLTDRGRQLRDQTIKKLDPVMAAFADRFSSGEIAEVTETLGDVRTYLDKARD